MKNNLIVLDASALLALINEEPGYQLVERVLVNCLISAVNLSEVITVLNNINANIAAHELVIRLIKEIVPFDQEQALIAANLRKLTKPYGLSFADRACLALAKIRNLPVLTADKIWSKLDIGLDIQLIR